MSYLFDLYRGEELDPSFFEFALYLAFFPVTISGPVCRMPDMLPQFRSEETTSWSDITLGIRRIAIGVLMMQVAKLLGQGILAGDGINSGFDRAAQVGGLDVWCLAFGYGLQLFFDFAGYSHVVIGAARALGITVPENFDHPFESTTLSVFWTRWHMSLSFWIRDYVFLPLAVVRREMWWRNLALVIAMVLFGLWHKASVLFLLWGLYHGVLLVLHRQVQQAERKFNWEPPSKLWPAVSWVATMSLINLGWIFFRANSLASARQMFSTIVSAGSYAVHSLSTSLFILVVTMAVGYSVVVSVSRAMDRYSVATVDHGGGSSLMGALARNQRFWVPPLYLLALLILIAVTHTSSANAAQFMYRNF